MAWPHAGVRDAAEEDREGLLVLCRRRPAGSSLIQYSATSSVAPQTTCSISVSHCVDRGSSLPSAPPSARCRDGLAAAAEQPRQEDRRSQHEQAEQPAAGLHRDAHAATAAAQAGEAEPAASLPAPVLDPARAGAADLGHGVNVGPDISDGTASAITPQAADADGAGADERPTVAEAGRRDAGVAAVRQAAAGAQLLLGGVEERRREPEGDAAADDDELEVEQVAQRCRAAPDDASGALHDLVGRLGRRAAGDRLDGQARRLGLEAAAGAAAAAPAVGLDDDVPDVAGVGRRRRRAARRRARCRRRCRSTP